MAFLTGGANTLDDSYSIENSLRCNGTDSYLNFTLGSLNGNPIGTNLSWSGSASRTFSESDFICRFNR